MRREHNNNNTTAVLRGALVSAVLLISSSSSSTAAAAFVAPRHMPRAETIPPTSRTTTTTTTSSLSAWFGRDDESKSKQKKKNKNAITNGNSGSVDALPSNFSDGMGTTATTLESFKASQEVGKRTAQLTNELSSMTVEGSAADGRIKAYMDGQGRPTGIKIDEALLGSGVLSAEELNDAITKALRDAYDRSLVQMEEKMSGLYSDLGLPSGKS